MKTLIVAEISSCFVNSRPEGYYGTFDIKFGEDIMKLLRVCLCAEIFRFQKICVKFAEHAVASAKVNSQT